MFFRVTLEEVIVTAQKREQSLQDVPISVNAVSGAKMEEAGITNLEGMTAYVPNLTMNQTGIGTNIAIRGISSGINQGFEQSVGQYVDGIYYGRAQLARAPFMDLERVEVLRGPQSILFGKNSIAGAISMITAKPTEEFEGSISVLYEPEHDEQDVRLVLSGPITDNLLGRLAMLDRSIDGYFDNKELNRDESDEDEQVFRGSLRWLPNDDWKIDLKVEQGEFNTKGRFIDVINAADTTGTSWSDISVGNGSGSVDTVADDFDRRSNGDTSDNETDNVTLKVEYTFDDYTFTSITGYNAYEYEERCDCDFTELPLFDADTDEEFDQVSQEFRLTSPIGDTFDFIVGAFWQSSDLEFSDSINVRDESVLPNYNPAFNAIRDVSTKRNFDQDSDLWSVFAQGTFHFQDNFHLILGGRFTSEEKEASRRQFHFDDINGVEIPNSGAYALGNGFGTGTVAHLVLAGFQIEAYDEISDDRDETAFTPLVTLQYDFDNGSMVYATFTTGFKSGGFDVRSNAHPDPLVGLTPEGVFEFEEEEADSFEIGGKFVLADGAAELNAAIYRTEYTDLQTSQFDGTLGFNVTNAGEATSQGIELDGRWRVAEDWTLIGAFAYLDFEYDKFPNGQCYFAQTPNGPFAGDGLCDQKGETREFAPEYTASFTADYATSLTDALEFRGSLDLIYSDDYFASPTLDPNLEQDSYTKVNARVSIGAADGKWDVALVGKNLTDEEVISFGNTLPTTLTLSGNTATAYYAFYDRPRSIAIQGTLRF